MLNTGDDVRQVFHENDLVGSGAGVLLVLQDEDSDSYIMAQVITCKTKVVTKTLDRFFAMIEAARHTNHHEYSKENAPALLVLPADTDIGKNCIERLEDEGVEGGTKGVVCFDNLVRITLITLLIRYYFSS